MTAQILKNVRIFSGGADLTGASNKIEVAAEVEEKDVTTWGSVDANGDLWKEVMGGLASAKISAGGFWEAGDTSKVDDDAWAALGGAGAWTVFPNSLTGAVGAVALTTNMLRSNYQLLGGIGDVAPWTQSGTSTSPLLRGVGLHPPGTARTATGSGTAVLHVAVSATQRLYAALHVLSVAGTAAPTITVKIQSDDNSGFTSATDVLTFTAATARGSQFSSVAGPITDTYYRVNYTITGTNPSFLFVAAVGVF
jgi:hypothetical protein